MATQSVKVPGVDMVYVYALCEPDTETVRYIGKAENPKARLSGHLGAHRNSCNAKDKWILRLRDAGQKPTLLVLEEVPFGQGEAREKHWIAHYLSAGSDLLNVQGTGRKAGVTEVRAFTREEWIEVIRWQVLEREYAEKLMVLSKRWGCGEEAALERAIDASLNSPPPEPPEGQE